jgi:S-adenosylmethionine hydrolase
MAPPAGVIVLLTDFGLRDPYVGVMKGVILSIHTEARIIDLSHDVPSQGILDAYFILSNAYSYFPAGTIFVTVVDPGVGTHRAILAIQTDKYLFLAPDNGLLGFLEKDGKIKRIVHVRKSKYFLQPVSNTFHGRDIFAPVAAHLSNGVALSEFGPEVTRMERIATPTPKVTKEGVILGEIVSIDRFGNLMTNIPGERLSGADSVQVKVGRRVIPRISKTYAEGRKGALLALVGSTENLEIAVNKGNAGKKTGSRVGDAIRVTHSQA